MRYQSIILKFQFTPWLVLLLLAELIWFTFFDNNLAYLVEGQSDQIDNGIIAKCGTVKVIVWNWRVDLDLTTIRGKQVLFTRHFEILVAVASAGVSRSLAVFHSVDKVQILVHIAQIMLVITKQDE